MLELRLLGTTDLRGVDPAAADALLSQSKCVALLTYLALERPGTLHRRDRLVGLLWPELDQEHARAALRKAVHALRRTLGPDVVAARGDEELGLTAGALWCDAIAFEECVERHEYEPALDLYRRDLLPGFYVPDAGEFEDWLERARTALRDRAAAAAWAIAARSEEAGKLTVSTRYARQAIMLAPADERMLRRVMQLLDRLGDRAGAVFVYEDFARRLKREYGAEPSAETQALRGGSRPASPTR